LVFWGLLAPKGAAAGFLPVPVLALGWSLRRVSQKQQNVAASARSSSARSKCGPSIHVYGNTDLKSQVRWATVSKRNAYDPAQYTLIAEHTNSVDSAPGQAVDGLTILAGGGLEECRGGKGERARLDLAQNFVTRDWALIGRRPAGPSHYLKSFARHCPINSYSTQISS
jgi:hypothetical protein